THNAVDGSEHKDYSRTFRAGKQASQPEDDSTFILRQNLDRGDQVKPNDDCDCRNEVVHFLSFSASANTSRAAGADFNSGVLLSDSSISLSGSYESVLFHSGTSGYTHGDRFYGKY